MTKYRVVAYKTDDHSVDDDTLLDDYGEAAELACNWQQYYDDCFEFGTLPEICVCVEEILIGKEERDGCEKNA